MTRTVADARDLVARSMSEDALLENVHGLAFTLGWRFYHTHDSRRSPRGFPDTVLVRPPRLLFVELKRESGKPTPSQQDWLADLRLVPGVEVELWRPSDWLSGRIERSLR